VIDDDEFEVGGRDDEATFQPAPGHAAFYADMERAVEQELDDLRRPGAGEDPKQEGMGPSEAQRQLARTLFGSRRCHGSPAEPPHAPAGWPPAPQETTG
jgi:hypothetical protein